MPLDEDDELGVPPELELLDELDDELSELEEEELGFDDELELDEEGALDEELEELENPPDDELLDIIAILIAVGEKVLFW